MNFALKTYSSFILSLAVSVFSYADESIQAATPQVAHIPFKPNKRHMHEKKEMKKNSLEKKPNPHAARIHKKQTSNDQISHEKANEIKALPQNQIDASKHHEKHHQTKIARHHKKEPELLKEKKEEFIFYKKLEAQ